MGFWDKVKETAQKAADAAKDQMEREDSLLNKTVEGAKSAADKAVVVAKDQYHRQDSALNKVIDKTAAATDNLAGNIDNMESGRRDDAVAMAKRYQARKKSETTSGIEAELEQQPKEEKKDRFPNTQQLTDEEVYKQVAETIYPDFRSLPSSDKKWALCEIARYDKKIVNAMRSLGSAYIDTLRQLAEGDDAYQAALKAAGLQEDRELKRAFQNWLDDSYDEEFYADDDGGHTKAVRLVGWLVFSRVGGDALGRAFSDAGVRDVYGLAKRLTSVRTLVDAREAVVMQAFRPRRASFQTQFLVHKGINADVQFSWIEEGARDEGDGGGEGGDTGFSGGSLMEL